MIRHFRKALDNGLRIVTIPQPHLNVCEVSCYVGVGSRHERTEESGISHFLEHMLFRGAAGYPTSLELETAFEALGGNVNASTDAETTCYFSRFHPERVADGLKLFSAMLTSPLFRDIEIERKIILEEAREDYNEIGVEINPDSLMAPLIWPDSPLARPAIGSPEILAVIDEAMLRSYHARYYTPSNCVIAVAGKVAPGEIEAACELYFGDWAAPDAPTVEPVVPATPAKRSKWVHDSASQLTVQLAFPLPGRNSEHFMRLKLLRRILSGGVASRLMLRLRETLGLTYSIEANLFMLAETGNLTIDFMVLPENLELAVDEVCNVIAELRSGPIPETELERVVRTYNYDLDFSRDHPEEMAVRYGWGELVGIIREFELDRLETGETTPVDLARTAQDCLRPEEVRLVVVGPYREKQRQMVEACLDEFSGQVN